MCSTSFPYSAHIRRSASLAAVVCPLTFNSVNKLARGHADNFAVRLLCEMAGYGVSVVVVPHCKPQLHSQGYRLRPALWQHRLMLQLLGFIIDCPDPMKLAVFYSQVTGRAIMEGSGDNMAAITVGDVDLAFQRVEDYRPPRWPDGEHPKQYHLDFEVSEIEPEQHRVVELGATLQKDFIEPDGYGWQVYTDPAGHPFCLCRHEGVTWANNKVTWP